MARYDGANASIPQQFLNDVMFGTFLEKNKKEITKGLANLYGIGQDNAGRENVARIGQQTQLETTEMEADAKRKIATEAVGGELERENLTNRTKEAVAKIMADAGITEAGIHSKGSVDAATAGKQNPMDQITAMDEYFKRFGGNKTGSSTGFSYKPEGSTLLTGSSQQSTDPSPFGGVPSLSEERELPGFMDSYFPRKKIRTLTE